MSLFGKKEKEEIARLNAEMQSLRDAMPSESRTLDDINREIKASREELARVQEHLERCLGRTSTGKRSAH